MDAKEILLIILVITYLAFVYIKYVKNVNLPLGVLAFPLLVLLFIYFFGCSEALMI